MKYATRMVLIPETEYLSLKESSNEIYKRKKRLNPKMTATQLTQELGKKIRLRDQETKVLMNLVKPTPKVKIVEHLPPSFHNKGSVLLSELALANIKHSENKELVLPSGEMVPRSNMTDLLKEALHQQKKSVGRKPVGWTAFVRALAASPVPMMLLNQTTRAAIAKVRPTLVKDEQDIRWFTY